MSLGTGPGVWCFTDSLPLDPTGSPGPDIRALEILNPLKGALS